MIKWIVQTTALVGLCLAIMAVVSGGVEYISGDTRAAAVGEEHAIQLL